MNVDEYCLKTLNPEFKGVVFQYLTNALYNNQQNFKTFSYKICRESLMTNHLVFYFRKGFYLVETINEKIRVFRSSGITNFFISRYSDEKYRKIEMASDGPTPLTVHHFIGIIQLWIFGLVFSSVLFSVEFTFHKTKKVEERTIKN